MEELFIFIILLFLKYLGIYGDSFGTAVVPINIEPNTTIQSALRYGFQKTGDCLHFEKAYLCIQKCLDLNYDVAHSDKNCKCTCYSNRDKAKYTVKYNTTRTRWKLGAPTTSIPPWAQEVKKAETTEPDNIVDVDESDAEHDSNHSNCTSVTAGGLEESGTSIGPLANVTESGGVESKGTAMIQNATVLDGKKSGGTDDTTAVTGGITAGGADGTTVVPGGTSAGDAGGTTVADADGATA